MTTNSAPLWKTPAGQGSLCCKSGPIYIFSFYLFSRHNSVKLRGGFEVPPHQYFYQETISRIANQGWRGSFTLWGKTIPCWTLTQYFLVLGLLLLILLLSLLLVPNLVSLNARLNSHEVWSYKKKNHKNNKTYRKTV